MLGTKGHLSDITINGNKKWTQNIEFLVMLIKTTWHKYLTGWHKYLASRLTNQTNQAELELFDKKCRDMTSHNTYLMDTNQFLWWIFSVRQKTCILAPISNKLTCKYEKTHSNRQQKCWRHCGKKERNETENLVSTRKSKNLPLSRS